MDSFGLRGDPLSPATNMVRCHGEETADDDVGAGGRAPCFEPGNIGECAHARCPCPSPHTCPGTSGIVQRLLQTLLLHGTHRWLAKRVTLAFASLQLGGSVPEQLALGLGQILASMSTADCRTLSSY